MKTVLIALICFQFAVGEGAGSPVSDKAERGGLDGELLKAAEQNDLRKVTDLLTRGAAVDALDTNGWSALIFGAKAGNVDMVTALLAKGADPNRRSSTELGSTVLCFAVGSSNLTIAERLLAHGADINLKSRNGTTPLCHAALTGNLEAAKFLLAKGADIELLGQRDDKGYSYTPLMAAAYNGHVAFVELLLARGAKLETTNEDGNTALMLVAKKPHPAAVKLLLQRGANANARRAHGHTALIYAAYNGHTENVRLLLAGGADPFATATDGKDPDDPRRYSAADLASQRGHRDALSLILKARAQLQQQLRAAIVSPRSHSFVASFDKNFSRKLPPSAAIVWCDRRS